MRKTYERHGMKGTPEYNAWINMRARCNNPNSVHYKHYGGRGIRVCLRWYYFSNFYNDLGPRPDKYTLERLNNDLGYFPENCVWATRKAQSTNRRDYSVFKGVSFNKCVGKWRAYKYVGNKQVHIGQYSTNLAACYAKHAHDILWEVPH